MALRRSPLFDRHVDLAAKMAEFGGWEMPLDYTGSGGGVIKEHTAVREAVGVFDVSHLGKATAAGPGAAEFVNTCLTNDLNRIKPGAAQYTMCCDDASGGVVDDMIAYLFGDERVFLVPNAANTAEVVRRMAAAAPGSVTVTDEHHRYGLLAVQGPRSADLLDRLGLPSDHDYMSFAVADWRGGEVVVCRTGYTGEHGYELRVGWDDTPALWDALLDAGTELAARACGLAARDTLRTEAGLALHGQDLSLSINPVRARLGFAVGWKKPEFWGRSVLLAERAAGPPVKLWGLESLDRGIPRPGMTVRDQGGADIGAVTSGTFSPTLRKGIGLALLSTGVDAGAEVTVDVRGRQSAMRVAAPPFVEVRAR